MREGKGRVMKFAEDFFLMVKHINFRGMKYLLVGCLGVFFFFFYLGKLKLVFFSVCVYVWGGEVGGLGD